MYLPREGGRFFNSQLGCNAELQPAEAVRRAIRRPADFRVWSNAKSTRTQPDRPDMCLFGESRKSNLNAFSIYAIRGCTSPRDRILVATYSVPHDAVRYMSGGSARVVRNGLVRPVIRKLQGRRRPRET